MFFDYEVIGESSLFIFQRHERRGKGRDVGGTRTWVVSGSVPTITLDTTVPLITDSQVDINGMVVSGGLGVVWSVHTFVPIPSQMTRIVHPVFSIHP